MSLPSLHAIQERKKILRARCLACRRALSPEQVAVASRAIQQQVMALPEYACARLVHTYVASKDNEVDTRLLIAQSLARGRRVAVPVIVSGTRRLRHAEIRALDQLQPDLWGLFSPRPGQAVWLEDLDEIDLVVVPGVAFDLRGYRLGFGSGYYDRFLAQVQAIKVGLSYASLLFPQVPAEPHDVPVDFVVTESAVHPSSRS